MGLPARERGPGLPGPVVARKRVTALPRGLESEDYMAETLITERIGGPAESSFARRFDRAGGRGGWH